MAGNTSFIFILLVCFHCALSQPAEDGVTRSVNALYNIYEKCENTEDLYSCIKIKALKFADRALKVATIPVVSGLNIIKNEGVDEGRSAALSEFDETLLPKNFDRKHEILDEFLAERISKFFNTHSVQLNMPKIMDDAFKADDKTASFEGRGKMKKYIGPLLIGAMMKGGMMAYALKAVGILAAKALMVSKIALVLASIIALKKLVGGGGGHHESKTIEIVQKPQISHSHTYSSGHDFGGGQWEGGEQSGGGGGGGGGGYGRNFDASPSTVAEDYSVPVGDGVDSQDIAYRGRHLHKQ